MTIEPKPPSKMGRPSDYSPEIGLAICHRLAAGESLRRICTDENLPNRSTVFTWLHQFPDFRMAYIAARECGAEALADEVVDMALSATAENANAVRVAVDAVKWAASKYAPKRWGGDRVEISGPDGRPVQLQGPPTRMVPAQVAAGIKALLTKAEESAGIPTTDRPDEERLTAILASDEPMDADLYEAIFTGPKE